MKDYYEVLGLKPSATADEIKKAYRRLARTHHPDRNPGNAQAEERFKEVQEAYSLLSDPEKRKQYDRFRSNPFGQYGGRPGTGGQGDGSSFRFEGAGWEDIFGGGGGGVSDWFERIFPGGSAGRSGPKAGRARGQRNAETSVTVRLPFDRALKGGKVGVTLPDGKRVRVDIPRGVDSGFKIRLRGHGAEQPGRAQRGDVLITFEVESHPSFQRSGRDLTHEIEVNPFEAMLGSVHSITDPYGKRVRVTIPPGTQPGDKLRLKGLGIQTDNGSGDLFILVSVRIPSQLTSTQREALRNLALKGGWLKD